MSKKPTGVSVLLLLCILLTPFLTFAQTIVSGHVFSTTDHSPVPSATISIKGTRMGVSTGIDGGFTIKAKEGDVLVVSGIGVVTQELTVGGDHTLTINVATNARSLSEVVVTATGIRKEAKRIGYSVQTIDASTLSQAREPDPINSLKGNAAGLTININQEVGHAPDVIMRGENDPINQPMYVVDGVHLNSDTYNISPDDIETFTILKGPAAAALYGFLGKNGAIIITTKKGSKTRGRTAVDFNSSTQFNHGFIALPKYQDEYGAGDGGIYAFGGGGGGPESGPGGGGFGVNDNDYDIWGPKFDPSLMLPQYDGVYSATQSYTTNFPNNSHTPFTGHIAPTPWIARGKDNLKHFIQTGLLSTNSIAVSSSSDKTDFRLSFGDTWQRGIIPNTQLNNGNFTLNLTHRISDRFTVSGYFNYSRQSSANLPDVTYGANSPIYNIILWGGADWNIKDMRNYWQKGKVGEQELYEEYYRYNNPYFVSYEWLHGHYVNNEYGYISANYKLNDNIDFMLRPSVTTYDMLNTEKLPFSASTYGRYSLRQGDYREDRRSLFESNVEFQGRYHRNNILGFLDLQGLVGANVRTFDFTSNFESTNYLNAPGIYAFSNTQFPLLGSSFNSSMKVLSAYYSVDLGYKSYITANITGRGDRSSSLPANSNTYFYPSFNLATVVSDYVNLPDPVSFFKLRASYAESKDGGTSPTFAPPPLVLEGQVYGYNFPSPYGGPNYQFSQPYNLTATYNNQPSAYYTSQTVNPNIQTADRKAYEFGADLRFLKNRIGLDVTRYHYRNSQIVQEGTSLSSGFASYLTNSNIYTNDGWEMVLNASPFKNPKGFSWNITANWFTYVRKWVNDANPDQYSHNGTRVDLVYGNGFVRTPNGQFVMNGGVQLIDAETGSSALKVFGHSDPDWQWGVVNNFSYKNFSFRFQFDGSVGGVIEDGVRKKTLQGGRHIETIQGALGVARPNDGTGVGTYVAPGMVVSGGNIVLDPKTEQITNAKSLTFTPNTTPVTVQGYVSNEAAIPDQDIVKKTYAKLREVAFSYTIPQTVFGKSGVIQKMTVSFVGRNLLYFFANRFKDFDVDQYQTLNSSAVTLNPNSPTPAGAYTSGLQTPTTRSYGFNLNISF
jgi:TonB-linked SusC/RagA family outer membrane protein